MLPLGWPTLSGGTVNCLLIDIEGSTQLLAEAGYPGGQGMPTLQVLLVPRNPMVLAWSRWVHAEKQVQKHGAVVLSPNKQFPMKSPYLSVADQAMEQMRKLMVEFGLTPSSRSRIRVPGGGETGDELDRFLEAG